MQRRSRIRPMRSHYFSPRALTGMIVPTSLMLIAGIAFVSVEIYTHAAPQAAINMDCTLVVPTDPLSAKGLAMPYQLVATNPANGPCNEANAKQAAFVQGAVIDPATGKISIYNPLVVDQGKKPAADPVVPTLPANPVVALWFGSNGNNLTLAKGNSLMQGNCVNGVGGSLFGQFAYCNAPNFFKAANIAIQGGLLTPPALGIGKDGMTCPTVRDFGVVDMDQSDNVTTNYLVNSTTGETAQDTAANGTILQGTQMQKNGSDNRLVAVALDTALGCTPFMAPDLANNGTMTTALPLNELQAAAQQPNPVALVPAKDPMVLNNNAPDLNKLDAYRLGVDQPTVKTLDQASTTTYCSHLRAIGPARIQSDMQFTKQAASPDPLAANSLFTFLAQRFVATDGANGLNCVALLNPTPITVTNDANGITIAATIATTPATPTAVPASPTVAPTIPAMTSTSPMAVPATPTTANITPTTASTTQTTMNGLPATIPATTNITQAPVNVLPASNLSSSTTVGHVQYMIPGGLGNTGSNTGSSLRLP